MKDGLPAQTINKVVDMRSAGTPVARIASTLGISARRVNFVLDAHYGAPIRATVTPANEADKIREMRDAGYVKDRIAGMLGVPMARVIRALATRRNEPNLTKEIK